MFNECKSLLSLPDISKWNIKIKVDIDDLFYGCSKSLNIPKNFNNFQK